MRRMALFMALSYAAVFGLSGCNTIQGAGEDIEAAGQEISEEAEENS